MATVAIDAVSHGEHPAGGAKSTIDAVAKFFAVDFATQGFKSLILRDNWRQSTYDKLQLVRLLTDAANTKRNDIDGDGKDDLLTDRAHFAYFGVSLGGNALLRWAEEAGHSASAVAHAVCSICSPIDLAAEARDREVAAPARIVPLWTLATAAGLAAAGSGIMLRREYLTRRCSRDVSR